MNYSKSFFSKILIWLLTIKKLISLVTVMVIILLSFSCGNSNQKEVIVKNEVKPLTTKIKGEIGRYIEVVDDSYKIEKSDILFEDWRLTLKFKKISSPTSQIISNIINGRLKYDLKITITDETGKPISGFNEFNVDNGLRNQNELDKLKALLTQNENTEEWITLLMDLDYDSKYKDKLPEGISKFTIHGVFDQNNDQSNNNSYNNNLDQSSNDSYGNEDWDADLNNYENYIDQIVEFVKEAQNNENISTEEAVNKYGSEHPYEIQKIQILINKLQNAQEQNILSSNQISRLTNIKSKLLNFTGK